MLQPYISYLKYDFRFTRPFVVDKYSKRNRNYKGYQRNPCKKRREKLRPCMVQELTTGQTPCGVTVGMEQPFRGWFWCAHPRARTHTLPTPAHLLSYRLWYLWQPVEVIAILPSYMLIHLHQKGRQKFECANHHYPVMWVAILNVHFICRCFATVPYQQSVQSFFCFGFPSPVFILKAQATYVIFVFPQGQWEVKLKNVKVILLAFKISTTWNCIW